MTHVDVLESDFLCNQINGPDANAVVVDSDQLGVGVVEESNLVCDVHTDWVAAESLSCFDLILN